MISKLDKDDGDAGDSPVVLVIDVVGQHGCSIAKNLTARGVRVVLAGNHGSQLALIADSLGIHFCVIDATDGGDIVKCIQLVLNKFGRVDGIAHCSKGILLEAIRETQKVAH
jgi:NADP-dependent 3-hydroxy acid dehydrogenase YdfG